MGYIHEDVRKGRLADAPSEEPLLKAFLANFDVNWGALRRASNTELSVYLLTADTATKQSFGLEREVALLISHFPSVQARTLQAAEQILAEHPLRGRIEQTFFFLITPDTNAKNWLEDYATQYPQARTIVALLASELIAAAGDGWFIRNALTTQLFSRDLFSYQLPVDSDLSFFGRESVVAALLDSVRQSQNIGLFGLRKTGKTSVLFKTKRMFEAEERGLFLYYDCKLPSLRMLRWFELLERIIEDICKFYSLPLPSKKRLKPAAITQTLQDILHLTPAAKITSLVFDEVEYISPLSTLDKHWAADFLPFWQTLWGVQSQFRRLSSTISGVNASLVEQDKINGVQNPMFGIVRQQYLRGLESDETKQMLKSLGRRMGIRFPPDAVDYLQSQYGGHPLLTRMACSWENRQLLARGIKRPTTTTVPELQTTQAARDDELSYYCVHVLSVLMDFYPQEYELVKVLELDGQAAFHEKARTAGSSINHLQAYGLLKSDAGFATLEMPVVGAYLKREHMRSTGAPVPRRVIPLADRARWIQGRIVSISRSIRDLDKIIDAKGLGVELYGANSFPFAEDFANQQAVGTKAAFVDFANVANKCLVEPLENIGKKKLDKNYFWVEVKRDYPHYWQGLQRVKIYRHMMMHAQLDEQVQVQATSLLRADLSGKHPEDVPDGWFLLQQSILDYLFLGIQYELDKYS